LEHLFINYSEKSKQYKHLTTLKI